MKRAFKPAAVAGLLLVTGGACWVMCTPVVPTRHVASVSQTNDEAATTAEPAVNPVNPASPVNPANGRDRAEPNNTALPEGVHSGQPTQPSAPQSNTVAVRSALLTTVPRSNPTPENLAITQAKSSDPRSLALLSTIERDLHRAPPPEVHALVRAHAEGESREQLLARLEQTLAQELSLKLYVRRWIDQVTPDPNQPPAQRKPLLSKGAGTGWVAPITTR
jgi:hypothetical protein